MGYNGQQSPGLVKPPPPPAPADRSPALLTLVGLSLYAVNLAVGLAAQLWGIRFGRFHHVLYGTVFAAAIAAAILEFHPSLLVTLAALAAFPKARPRTSWHPALAVLGLLGYVPALIH